MECACDDNNGDDDCSCFCVCKDEDCLKVPQTKTFINLDCFSINFFIATLFICSPFR